MNYFKNRSKILILISLLVLILISIIWLKVKNKQEVVPPMPTMTPTAVGTSKPQSSNFEPINRPESREEYQTISTSDRVFLDQSSKVSDLINKLPKKGSFFSMSYNFKGSRFLAVLDKDNQARANEEFDRFLSENGINNRSWFRSLDIEIK